MARKSIEQTRHKTPPNKEHNAEIVELIAKLSDGMRMVRDGVVRRAHAETSNSAYEEAAQRDQVGRAGEAVARRELEVQHGRDGEEEQRPQKVRVDVDGLIVDVAQAEEAHGVATRGAPVKRVDVVVVALPGFEVFPGYHL